MYPQRDLTRLGARKSILQARITRGRADGAVAAARVLRPLARLERLLLFSRKLAPVARLALIPLGLLLRRSLASRLRRTGAVLRWAPLLAVVARGVRAGLRRSS